MKKHLKLSFLLLASLLGLASCGGETSSASSESESASESSSIEESSSESSSAEESSEESSSSSATPTIGDENWVYYAEDLYCKLSLDYTDRVWETDGIEQVTLYKSIDGDTAHFNISSANSNTLLKVRFYGIDTPESTGDVQPYGKQAKWYTADALEKANENGTIVISSASSEYGAPEHDSTGSRYVGLVWYHPSIKNCPFDQLILLNLEIVEYGYSWVKNVADMPDFVSTFYAAETQAKNYLLKLHSGEDDPYYNYGGYEDVTLLELKNSVIEAEEGRYEPPIDETTGEVSDKLSEYDNEKVRIQGAVAGFSNHILYLQDFVYYTDEEGNYVDKDGNPNTTEAREHLVTGEYCGINIFVGMSTIRSKFTTIGNYIQVCGLGSYTSDYGFQITDADFPALAYSESDSYVVYTADEVPEEHQLHIFEMTYDELYATVTSSDEATKYQYMNCRVSLTDEAGIQVTGGYDGDGYIRLYTSHYDITTYHTFNYKPYGTSSGTTWETYTKFVDHYFRFSGCLALYHQSSGTVRQTLYLGVQSDITWVDTDAA